MPVKSWQDLLDFVKMFKPENVVPLYCLVNKKPVAEKPRREGAEMTSESQAVKALKAGIEACQRCQYRMAPSDLIDCLNKLYPLAVAVEREMDALREQLTTIKGGICPVCLVDLNKSAEQKVESVRSGEQLREVRKLAERYKAACGSGEHASECCAADFATTILEKLK